MVFSDPLMKEALKGLPEGTFFIPQCGVYVKKESSLEPLLDMLRRQGYEVEKTKYGSYFAKLGETVLQLRGKCDHCQAYISERGIRSHDHRCEACGKPIYLKFVDGGTVKFYFRDDEELGRAISMKVRGYDEATGSLLLYPDPIDGRFLDAKPDKARVILAANRDKWRWVYKSRSQGGCGSTSAG